LPISETVFSRAHRTGDLPTLLPFFITRERFAVLLASGMDILAVVRTHIDLVGGLAVQRKRRGFSRETIAERAGFDPKLLRRLEAGTKTAGRDLQSWLDALDVEFVLVERSEIEASKLTDLPNSPTTYHKTRKIVAAKGGRQRLAHLSDARRRERAREIARIAGRARQTKLQQERERQDKMMSLKAAKSARERVCPPPARSKGRARKRRIKKAPTAI
jgi:transcriptional regulator with XRE-family HTH domain